jgi:hypothetical protein
MAVKKTAAKPAVKKAAPKKAAPKKAPAKKPVPKPAPAKKPAQPIVGVLVTAADATTLPATVDNTIHDDELRIIAQRVVDLKKANEDFDMPIVHGKPLAGPDLDAWLNRKEDQAAVGMVELGVGYLLKKRELGHGAFMGWVKDKAGVSQSSVNEKMKVASLLVHLSEENSRRAANLPQRKLAALAGAPALLINDLFDSGALDDADSLSRDELRELIALRKEVEKQTEREHHLNEVIHKQDEELRKRRALPEPSQHAAELRRAVLDETEALRANAYTLQMVMDKITLLPSDLPQAELDAIVHPLMYALQALHITAASLLDYGHQRCAGYHRDVDILPPPISDEEARRAIEAHEEFLAAATDRAAHRQMDLSLAKHARKTKAAA